MKNPSPIAKLVALSTTVLWVSGCSPSPANAALDSGTKLRTTSNATVLSTPSEDTLPSASAEMVHRHPVGQEQYYVNNKFLIRADGPTALHDKIVLLTFDDGPSGTSTEDILKTLEKYHAAAIWFISGFRYGPQYRPDQNKSVQFTHLVQAIQSDGNIIGNHTWIHANLSQLSAQKQIDEVTKVNEVLTGITGETPEYLRPPYGVSTTTLNQEMKALGMQWMNWSVGSKDWVYTDPKKVEHQVLSTVYSGAVILMHDNAVEAKALDPILKELTAEGYHFVLPTEVRPN